MKDKLALLYFEVTNLWKQFCEEHNELFNLTCDEYSLLLKSDLELLEEKINEKNECIARIGTLEMMRRDLIKDISALYPEKNIDSVSALLEVMSNYEIESNQKHLFRFNALLIDIIEKIQAQNKRNQLFINKALHSLQQIRIEASGKKNYSTYSAKGSAVTTST
ncbi:FlgN protein [Bacteriovorax stolpii]|nr:flagellar export chaperone FlgN [Bacteriovorax stolpii]TDP54077.1 FlgN protein [Bacteriovorax stolpii]BDT30221.1 flagellar export chaperone FlgN [Bacteriovorax sp. HI3]